MKVGITLIVIGSLIFLANLPYVADAPIIVVIFRSLILPGALIGGGYLRIKAVKEGRAAKAAKGAEKKPEGGE